MARPALLRSPVTRVLVGLLAVLLAACGSSRSSGMQPLPEDEPEEEDVFAYYEVECDRCSVTWLAGGNFRSTTVDGSWRQNLEVQRGDRLYLTVRRGQDRYVRVIARIVVRGRVEDRGRLQTGQRNDRLVLEHRVR